MNAKYIAVFLCLVGVVFAQSYTEWQQGAMDGLNIGFKLGQAYEKASNGLNINEFNTLVDSYNAWVKEHFGEGSNLFMQKITTPNDLTKPVLITNNTNSSGGIVHKIDGMNQPGPTYTTNDINSLPVSAIEKYAAQDLQIGADGKTIPNTRNMGDGYLSGV